jgi:hypothetical protein
MLKGNVTLHRYLNLISVATLALIAFTLLAASSCSEENNTKLIEVPIQVGNMAFNEYYNHGFEPDTVDDWSTNDLYVTTDGHISGTFKTMYSGKASTEYQIRDVLVVVLRAKYVRAEYGDYFLKDLTDVLPFVAQQSDESTAAFEVKGTFNIPSMGDKSSPLAAIQIDLTWVRVYKREGVLYYQILAGDADRYDPNIPTITFNKPLSKTIQSRFLHYSVLFQQDQLRYNGIVFPEINEFNYCTWIEQNVEW